MMYREDQERLTTRFKEHMRLKYESKALILMENLEFEQNRADLNEIIEKANKYIEKHTFLKTRKIILFRFQGVIFG